MGGVRGSLGKLKLIALYAAEPRNVSSDAVDVVSRKLLVNVPNDVPAAATCAPPTDPMPPPADAAVIGLLRAYIFNAVVPGVPWVVLFIHVADAECATP